MEKTLFISDIDGTLLADYAGFSYYTVKILNRALAAGARFTLATGRAATSVLRITKPLRLDLPIIINNGAECILPGGEVLRRMVLKPEWVEEILQVMRAKDCPCLIFGREDGQPRVIYGEINRYIKSYMSIRAAQGDMSRFIRREPIHARGIEVVGVTSLDALDHVSRLQGAFPSMQTHIIPDHYTGGHYFEIAHPEANKGEALGWLKAHLNIDRVVAFGDSANDLPLFQAADECYAVDNADPRLKEAATGVIGANDRDGVARYIARRLNIPED